MRTPEETTFQGRFQRLETLIQEIETAADPAMRARVEELLQVLLQLHGEGLERTLELIWDRGEAGQTIIHEQLAQDEQVSALLLLHGLHPLDLETRVRQALDKLRPSLQTQGSQIELLGLTAHEGVKLRVIKTPPVAGTGGGCHSCASPQINLREVIEEAIFAAAPEVTEIELEGLAEVQPRLAIDFIPLISR